jgi:predicted PurR-regulated permease PerM
MPNSQSPPWNQSSKVVAVVALLLLGIWLVARFPEYVADLVVAAMIAYLLEPFVKLGVRNLHMPRPAAVLTTFLVFALVAVGALILVAPSLLSAVNALLSELPEIFANLGKIVEGFLSSLVGRTFALGGAPVVVTQQQVDAYSAQLSSELQKAVSDLIGQALADLPSLAGATAGNLIRLTIVVTLAIFLSMDAPSFWPSVVRIAGQAGYGDDALNFSVRFVNIWNVYLRGQLVLALTMGTAVTVLFFLLGIGDALALGIVAGLLQFIPVLGAYAMMFLTIVVLLFQPDTVLGLSPLVYMALVVAALFALQQIVGSVVTPVVFGSGFNLNPALMLVSVLAGGALAGILGLLLAAPVVASAMLLIRYTWCKVNDLPGFPETPPPVQRKEGRKSLARQLAEAADSGSRRTLEQAQATLRKLGEG